MVFFQVLDLFHEDLLLKNNLLIFIFIFNAGDFLGSNTRTSGQWMGRSQKSDDIDTIDGVPSLRIQFRFMITYQYIYHS